MRWVGLALLVIAPVLYFSAPASTGQGMAATLGLVGVALLVISFLPKPGG